MLLIIWITFWFTVNEIYYEYLKSYLPIIAMDNVIQNVFNFPSVILHKFQ